MVILDSRPPIYVYIKTVNVRKICKIQTFTNIQGSKSRGGHFCLVLDSVWAWFGLIYFALRKLKPKSI